MPGEMPSGEERILHRLPVSLRGDSCQGGANKISVFHNSRGIIHMIV